MDVLAIYFIALNTPEQHDCALLLTREPLVIGGVGVKPVHLVCGAQRDGGAKAYHCHSCNPASTIAHREDASLLGADRRCVQLHPSRRWVSRALQGRLLLKAAQLMDPLGWDSGVAPGGAAPAAQASEPLA